MNKVMSGKKMVLRWSLREIYHGQLWPVFAALTLIVACVVALSALALRVEGVMTNHSRGMLAADLVLHSDTSPSTQLLENANKLNLLSSLQTRFQTMAFSDNEMQLVSVQAVQSNYPLRGELLLEDAKNVLHVNVQPGELWLSEQLFSLLAVRVGEQIDIGDAQFVISGKIVEQPELSFNPFRALPNVFIHQDDLVKTGAVQAGSRVQYRAFFSGSQSALERLQEDYKLQISERWRSENTQGRSADLIVKAKQYLSLTIVMVILMAAVTLVLTCQHYADSRTEMVAMLKSMGASKAWLSAWLLSQITIIFIGSLLLGALLGFILEILLRLPLTDILPAELPSYGYLPFVLAASVALLIALPALGMPLLRLLETPAIAVLQGNKSSDSSKGRWLVIFPIAAFLLYYGNNSLVWMVFSGLIVLFLLLALCSYGLLYLLHQRQWNAAMTLALSRIRRSPKQSMMQLAALSGSLMLVSVIWLLRHDLLGDWQQTLPADAPNVFAINIAPTEQLSYLQILDDNNIARSEAYPIVRGRLSQINGIDVNNAVSKEQQDFNILRREINFTWANQLPSYNEVIAGQWREKNGVSIEQSVAQNLDINIGDKLSFTVNSQTIIATVNTIRSVQWQSMKPNFYFIFTPDLLIDLPATWLLSFHLDDQQNNLLTQLGRDYPTVSLLNFRVIGEKIQALLAQISWSLTVLAGLGVVSGILLIFTLLRLSLHQRSQEILLYRTLGASRKYIRQTLLSEYGVMALSAGMIAALGAETIIYSLMKWGFQLTPSLHVSLWFAVPSIAIVIVFVSLSRVISNLLRPLR